MLIPALLVLAPWFALDLGDDYRARLQAAGKDTAQLWDVSQWCDANGLAEEQRSVLRRIVKLDPKHVDAHRGLRHHHYDERWFETWTALSKYRRAEDVRMRDEHGLVRWNDDWVPVADKPFLLMQWVRSEGGTWASPAETAERERVAALVARGWEAQDLTLVPPAEFEAWRSGKWKCGDRWLDTAAANAFHAQIAQPWTKPGEHFIAVSTCDREQVDWAVWWADKAYADLVRAVGVEPRGKQRFVVLRDVNQYNAFAGGDPANGLPPTEAAGYSSLHYAYVASAWFDTTTRPFVPLASGAAYWDAHDPALQAYGQHAVRHAAAQSYLEAIDPSWGELSLTASQQGHMLQAKAFWGEKQLPLWLRYGIASYVERYFEDPDAAEGNDSFWARNWALENVRSKGGLRDLDELFAFALDPMAPDDGNRMIGEAGAVVAFMLDGASAPVVEAHGAFKRALGAGEGVREAALELQEALADREHELRSWAKL